MPRVLGFVIAAALLLGLVGCGQGATLAPTMPPATRSPAPTATTPAIATASPSPTAPVPTTTACPTATATPTPIPASTPTPFPVPAGQIVFGAYPCASETDCGPYPGMEQDFALYSINTDGTDLRPITGEELREHDLLVRLPFVPDELVQRAEEVGHFRRAFSALPLFSYNHIRWFPDGSAWLEPGEDGLYLIQADGTGATRLVAGQIYYYDLSPDGKFVAYIRLEDNGIYVTEVASAASRQVAQLQLPARTRTDVFWDPTGERILLFVHSSSASHPAELYLLDNPTGETPQVQPLFRVADDESLFSPQWAPAGQIIYFVLCQERHTNSIIGFNAKSKEQQPIAHVTGVGGCITQVAWSPSRTHVVFSYAKGLYILDLETERSRRILSGYTPLGPLIWLPAP
ncbi:MAG: WD40 repeat domain-containing protein [Chloroflexota bacterium]|nr:WD40 repeat domain-containing protein [Chloroflexota bacterium]